MFLICSRPRFTWLPSKFRNMSTLLPPPIPLLTTVASFREWRQRAFDKGKSVGFVATMGALHDGHLSLVRRSLKENDLTVLSIFVNPAQFAPHEDLSTYPRTLPHDLDMLTSLSPEPSTTVVFLPSVQEMYPSGIDQEKQKQKGTFVDVVGFTHQMEGKSRPLFFRGVATIVTKLFNVVQPTNTYFGQKDIQQALILRRLVGDLLLSHPDPAHLHILPTARDPIDGLAQSSRNAYLLPEERKVAGTLRAALRAGETAWLGGDTKEECVRKAREVVEGKKRDVAGRVEIRLDYVEMNDSRTFDVLESGRVKTAGEVETAVILSGAMWVGKTRLIDNIILGDASEVLS